MNGQKAMPGFEQSNYHDFKQSLEFANVNTTTSRLFEFYKSVFTWLESVEKVTDIELQKQGIDTVIKFPSGKVVFFDEKVRKKDWPDILLEEFSVWRNYPLIDGKKISKYSFPAFWRDNGLRPGWVSGEKHTDYITYILKPTQKVYFIPFLLLQAAWKSKYKDWLSKFGRIPARNNGYCTTNIPVPIDILYQEIYAHRSYRST